jgi:hypothetical protein
MPVLPLKTRIRQEILARLSTIQAGATYWCTPSLVVADPAGIAVYANDDQGGVDYLATGPVLGIRREPGSQIMPTSHDTADEDAHDGLPAGWSGEYRFAIVGYVRAAGDMSASDWLDALQQDVVVCLLADPQLKTPEAPQGLVTDLRPDDPDENDGGVYAAEREAEFAQVWVARKWA